MDEKPASGIRLRGRPVELTMPEGNSCPTCRENSICLKAQSD